MKNKWIALLAGLALAVPAAAFAQELSLDVGEGGSATARMIQIVALITLLSVAPSLLMMVTSFTRIVIVLSFVRTAIGTATTPPNQVLVGLAIFLTFFIMAPVFQESYEKGISPLMEERISEEEAMKLAAEPFHKFHINFLWRMANIDQNKKIDQVFPV